MLKNAEGKVLLDGYILLHINYQPDNKEIVYPAEAKTFDLCNGLTLSSTWAQFSNIILQQGLTNEMILNFNDNYWADCVPGTAAVPADDEEYVTENANQVMTAGDGHKQYQLRLFNFGDLLGQSVSAAAQAAMKNGGAAAYEEKSIAGFQSNQGLGVVYYKPNGEGTTNHTFHWYLSPEEIEYITHDLQPTDYPVTVSRWIRYVAKDRVRGREVNNYGGYPYIWVKISMTITRKNNSVAYGVKTTNMWYHWNTGANNWNETNESAVNWSAIVWDIQAPRNGEVINRFNRVAQQSFVGNKINLTQVHKFYFAPKNEKLEFYTLNRTAMASTTAIAEGVKGTPYTKDVTTTKFQAKTIKSVLEGFTSLPAALQQKLLASGQVKKETRIITPLNTVAFNVATMAPGSTIKYNATPYTHTDVKGKDESYDNVNEWNQMFCKYVYPHTYANLSTQFKPDHVNVVKAQDKHQWVENQLQTLLNNCAIDYNNGVFNNNELYSFNPDTKEYILIAILNPTTGEIELVKNDAKAFEEAKLVLNAYGYEPDHQNIYKELRAWVGVVANNGCDVAMYTYPEKTNKGMQDESYDLNTFLVSWQRPINTGADPIEPKLDANSNENFIHMIDYLKLYDWRGDYTNQGYMYYDPNTTRADNHYWFWAYYHLKSIILDMNPKYVWTNLHYGNDYATLGSITDDKMDLWAYNDAWSGNKNQGLSIYNFDAAVQTFNSADKETGIESFMGVPNPLDPTIVYDLKKQRFGTIYYQNRGDNLVEFDLFVPYTIEYEWGWLSRIAWFKMNSTHGNH
jgi:hypothetical protein